MFPDPSPFYSDIIAVLLSVVDSVCNADYLLVRFVISLSVSFDGIIAGHQVNFVHNLSQYVNCHCGVFVTGK